MSIILTENDLKTLVKDCMSKILSEEVGEGGTELELSPSDYLNNVIRMCNERNIPWKEYPPIKKHLEEKQRWEKYPNAGITIDLIVRSRKINLADKLDRDFLAEQLADWANFYMLHNKKGYIFKKNFKQQFLDPVYTSVRALNDSVAKYIEKYRQAENRYKQTEYTENIYKCAKNYIKEYEKMLAKTQKQF